jgi:hypothetical protein
MICGVFMSRKKTLTEADRRQKQQASRTHGVFAVRDRGQEAMTSAQRSRYAELQEQFLTRGGVVDAMRDQAVNSLLLAEIAQSYIVGEHKAGVPLDEIPLLRSIPAFWNSAGRALKSYLDNLPDDSKILDLAEHVSRAMDDNGNDS